MFLIPKSLDRILNKFYSVHDDLDRYVKSHEGHIEWKTNLVNDLTSQISDHQNTSAKAKRIQGKIKEFLEIA